MWKTTFLKSLPGSNNVSTQKEQQLCLTKKKFLSTIPAKKKIEMRKDQINWKNFLSRFSKEFSRFLCVCDDDDGWMRRDVKKAIHLDLLSSPLLNRKLYNVWHH